MSTPANYDEPTPTQRKLLEFVLEHGGVERMPGGYWVKPGYKDAPMNTIYFGTSTIEACKRREWLRPQAGQDELQEWMKVHIITPHGLNAIRPKEAAGTPMDEWKP